MKNTALRIFKIGLLATLLTGCYNLHQIWIDEYQVSVGKSILDFEFSHSLRQFEPELSRVILLNGNIEVGYGYYFTRNRKNNTFPCRFFYEYEPKSGLIVGFRFEEDYKHACIVSGA